MVIGDGDGGWIFRHHQVQKEVATSNNDQEGRSMSS